LEKAGSRIGTYVLHYADAKQEEVPIVYGQDVHDWNPKTEDLGDQQGGAIAWKGSEGCRVYLSTWDNPRPDVELTSFDFVSLLTKCGPFLVALTAEP